MTKNPILDELHATRERLLAEAGGTVSGLLNRLRADQAVSKHPQYKPADNHPLQRSGEAVFFEVENPSSPPAER
jgi:hypothetical protein